MRDLYELITRVAAIGYFALPLIGCCGTSARMSPPTEPLRRTPTTNMGSLPPREILPERAWYIFDFTKDPDFDRQISGNFDFHLDLGWRIRPEDVEAFAIWIDTGGLQYSPGAQPQSIGGIDSLHLIDGEGWPVADGTDAVTTQIEGAPNGNEKRVWSSTDNPNHFDAVKKAISDGWITARIVPSDQQNEKYSVHMIRVEVTLFRRYLPQTTPLP